LAQSIQLPRPIEPARKVRVKRDSVVVETADKALEFPESLVVVAALVFLGGAQAVAVEAAVVAVAEGWQLLADPQDEARKLNAIAFSFR
jgi:hypothetical protein